ncbi:MAG: hypothetical protein ACK4RK_18250 [Gemmataceae bacterium]
MSSSSAQQPLPFHPPMYPGASGDLYSANPYAPVCCWQQTPMGLPSCCGPACKKRFMGNCCCQPMYMFPCYFPPCPGPGPVPEHQPELPKPEKPQPSDTTPDLAELTQPPRTAADPTLPPESGLALGGDSVAVSDNVAGYIDPAIPRSRVRLRYDAAYRNNRPDRAEYFYAKYRTEGAFGLTPEQIAERFPNILSPAGIDPNAPGVAIPELSVDYQDIRPYVELAFDPRFSVFVELPSRFLNPVLNPNTAGFADMNAGFKWAMIASPEQFLTFQMRTYIPTGDANRGLGTNHVSLEPGLLFYQQIGRFYLDAEFKDWIAVGGTDFAGNVLQYGVSTSYLIYNSDTFRVWPVVEFLCWNVLSGKESIVEPELINVKNASGDTIINGKFGVRFGFGELQPPGMFSCTDFYIGYGRAFTGDVWYKDLIRAELRVNF